LTKCSLHLTFHEYVVKKLPIAEYSVVKKLRLRDFVATARQARYSESVNLVFRQAREPA